MCRTEPPAPKKHSGHNRHTPDTRRSAVIAVAKVYNGGEPDYGAAAQAYKSLPKDLPRDSLGSNATTTLKTHWEEFMEHGDLKDKHRSGRPIKISDEDALKASELVKAGRRLLKKTKAGPIEIIVFFTTVRQAVAALPDLKKIMDDNHTDAKKLYQAMKRADPYLARRTLIMKPAFTAAQMRARNLFAKWLLQEMSLVQGERSKFWRRVVQCDEGRWTYSVKQKLGQKVLLDKRTSLLHDYITCTQIKGKDEMSVHWFMCVSPHPKFGDRNGLAWWDFTTGTSYIRRLRNTMDQTQYEAFGYMVSYSIIESARCHAHQQQQCGSCPKPHTTSAREQSHAA
jgi:hypothetical protein